MGLQRAFPAIGPGNVKLDEAVARACGWPGSIAEEDAFARRLALNADEGAA